MGLPSGIRLAQASLMFVLHFGWDAHFSSKNFGIFFSLADWVGFQVVSYIRLWFEYKHDQVVLGQRIPMVAIVPSEYIPMKSEIDQPTM